MKQFYAYGCLPPKKDLRDYKLCSANVPLEYPTEFKLHDLPRVKCQGTVNSCCAHATSSILEYYDRNKHQLSTNFIYGIQKKLFNQEGMGMYLAQACQIVTDYGDALQEDCKGNLEVPYCYSIAERAFEDKDIMERAIYFKTLSYYLCSTDNDIKYALMHYGPVLGAVMWRDEFQITEDNEVIFNRNSDGGGHAIMIYGWNSKGWLIQNSWGEQFAAGGRFILPYDYGFMEARALIDYENTEELVLVKPKRNWFLNICYKIGNFFLNIK